MDIVKLKKPITFVLIEAANEIKRLQEENERLFAANKDLRAWYDSSREDAAQLREALKEIADAYIPGVIDHGYNVRDWLIKHHTMLVDKARTALKEGE